MVVQEQRATALPVDTTARTMSRISRWRDDHVDGVFGPDAEGDGQGDEVEEGDLHLAPSRPRPPSTPPPPAGWRWPAGRRRSGRMTSRISSTTAISEATVAIGPSRRIERIMDGEDHRAARGLQGLVEPSGRLCSRCSTRGDAQQVLAVPDRDARLDGVDQQHPADGAVHLGERAAGQRRQVLGWQHPQVGGRIDAASSCFSVLVEQRRGPGRASACGCPRAAPACAACTSGVPGQDVVDGDDLADHVRAGHGVVLPADGGAHRLHLVGRSASTMVGWGQRPNSAFWSGVELPGWSRSTWMRAFSRRKSYSNGAGGEVQQPDGRQHRHHHRGHQQRGARRRISSRPAGPG